MSPVELETVVEAWANVNLRGDSNVLHIHPGNPLEAAYTTWQPNRMLAETFTSWIRAWLRPYSCTRSTRSTS